MEIGEAIDVLHWYQKYRRGGIELWELPYSVKDFGVAIDVAIRTMRKVKRDE